jgi:calcineurin-like phosphoesterase family protein
MKYWFTSDLHLGHANIIKYCHRPFKDIEEMNETIITNWNSRVKDGDLVFHVGDFCFKNSKGGKPGEGMQNKASHWRERLNGDIIFIKGNHDRNNSVKSIIERIVVKYGPHYICLVHNPENYDIHFAMNFVGHVHEKWKFRRMFNPMDNKYIDLINVGVDVWGFFPRTFEEIYKEYKRWSKQERKHKR